jgi:Flp pilus assembly protein TadD
MASPQEEFSYLIAVDDIDKSLLPPNARTPGTDAFREAVTRLILKDYEAFGGYARIVVDEQQVQVYWRSDPSAPDPMDVVIGKLKRGEYADAVRLLEYFRHQHPDNADVLYNLGMALSDMGRLPEAERHLRHAVEVAPSFTNAAVALGVALTRQRRYDDAVVVLRQAVTRAPQNPWAQRNLGACLLQTGQVKEAEACLRQAVRLNPADQQAILGLAQALEAGGSMEEVDGLYIKVIDLDGRTPAADVAREARSKLAQSSFRQRRLGGIRPDAVMYLLGALQRFEKMSREQVQKIAFEISIMGQRGLDTNDSSQQYRLQSLPGQYSGLNMGCLMYVGFQMIAPDLSIGFDLSKEYDIAKSMHAGKQKREGLG